MAQVKIRHYKHWWQIPFIILYEAIRHPLTTTIIIK